MHRLNPRVQFDSYILRETDTHVVYDFNRLIEDVARTHFTEVEDKDHAEELASWLVEDEFLEQNPEGGESARYIIGATQFWWSAEGNLESCSVRG